MDVFSQKPASITALADRLHEIVAREFDQAGHAVTYLNTGSVGRKPACVLAAVAAAMARLNENPTSATFLDDSPLAHCRQLAARLFSVNPSCLLMTGNTTQGLQSILSSFLLKPGDELVATDHLHGSARTIVRFLEEQRGIVVRQYQVPPNPSSEQLSFGLLALVSDKTRLVLTSEIDCFTGWRPDLTTLADSLELLDVPLLVDGAHAPGCIVTRPSRFPLWVGSGHKWLGGPNGTGFACVRSDLIPRLEPVLLGDGYFEKRDKEIYDITRFDCTGTSDVIRWSGLAAAIELQFELPSETVARYQMELVRLLRDGLAGLGAQFRTPDADAVGESELSAMLTFFFSEERLKVSDLRQALFQDHKIWIQPDFLSPNPGCGGRISCHYSVSETEILKLVEALCGYLI